MAKQSDNRKQEATQHANLPRPVVGQFFAKEVLLDESQAVSFPSESSLAWFVRNNRVALTEARAIAFHAGRMIVHPARFAAIAEAVALNNAATRIGGEAPNDD